MKKAGRYADKNFLAKSAGGFMGLGYGSETIYSVIGILMKERKEEDDKRCRIYQDEGSHRR